MATTQPPHPWIAELRVVFVHLDGRRVAGHIAVGEPRSLSGGDPAGSFESICAIDLDGLHSRAHPIRGAGSLQALLLAVRFLGAMLHEFVSRGGRVLDPEDDSEISMAALFGPLLQRMSENEAG